MKGQNNNWLTLSSVGIQITILLLLFGWLGSQVDKYFSINPYGLIVGLLIGAFFSLYEIWKTINSNK